MKLSNVQWDFEYDGEDFEISVSNYKLKGCIWNKVKTTPRFIYIFVHGLGAFATFKKDIFSHILENDGVVFACDHLGHGRSEGPRISCIISEIVDETKQVVLLAKEKYPDLPVFLHGHSMGGLTILSLCYRDNDFVKQNIKGLIAECPWIAECPQFRTGRVTRYFTKMLGWLLPSLRFPSFIQMFSDDTDNEWSEKIGNHPQIGKSATARLIGAAVAEIEYLWENSDEYTSDVPLFFMIGMKDNLVFSEQTMQFIKMLQDKNEGKEITCKSYEDGPHTLFKSKYRDNCIDDIVSYMLSHT